MKPPKQDYSQRMDRIDPDEKLLAIVKRHPFGLIKMYAGAIVAITAMVAIVLLVLPGMVSRDENPEVYSMLAVISVIILIVMVLILLVATYVYNQNKIVLTDKTITQTAQLTLFNRKISQLAVSSIEDVTANKAGIFPTMLDYGRLLVETAGEQENFHFDYCPKPDHYAKLILETRQQFMGHREFEMREAQMGYASYAQPPMPPQNYQYPPMPQAQQNQQPMNPGPQQYSQPQDQQYTPQNQQTSYQNDNQNNPLANIPASDLSNGQNENSSNSNDTNGPTPGTDSLGPA